MFRMQSALFCFKLGYQVVSGLVRLRIDHPFLDPLVVSDGTVDLVALLAHSQFRIRVITLLI